MNGITTHVLDVSIGKPAAGVQVTLERKTDDGWEEIGSQETDADGRARDLFPADERLARGFYRLTFGVSSYFRVDDVAAFYEEVTIAFIVDDTSQHYHVPLLLSPFGYSTYRGS